MNKLLIIAYYFPPSGGPGVQRVLKLTKYLSELGWEPVIFTVENGQFPAIDESLFSQIPEGTEIIRTHIYEPYDLYRLLTGRKKGTAIDVNVIKKESQKVSFKDRLAEFIRATFFIPDARMGWLFTAKKHIRELLKDEDIKAIYSSSPPYTCSLIAKYAKKKSGLPWVAGFRDPWTEFLTSPKRWFLPAIIDRKLEKSVFQSADYVESAWQGITKDALLKYPDLNSDKFIHIPNGFDSSDYPDVEYCRNDRFTITYTGSMYGRRNPESLFAAIESLIKSEKIDPAKILIRFVGRFGSEVWEMIENASFKNSIETVNYVPHEKSIEYLIQSEALLLIVDEAKESEEIVPGKVYEYIGTMRPVLAIGPETSAIADLLKETRAGYIAHQSMIEKIADHFYSYYKSWESDSWDISPDLETINQYERRNAAEKLVNLLENCS